MRPKLDQNELLEMMAYRLLKERSKCDSIKDLGAAILFVRDHIVELESLYLAKDSFDLRILKSAESDDGPSEN